ncbi:ATP-binding protein [uncultured Sphingomonas sp.]|uniref:HAMP domain-containing sensor histidine kinase n=1 Tax=uncultured Sphingomonas sp. TaxID=158754 RepID=UPI00259A64E0|nr:ATP-binding protein [uncultured Sphingomonas sp.]
MLAGLVGLGAGALLLTVERQIGHYAREASDGMLHAESSVLAGEYATLGLSGLTDAIARHGGVGEDPPYRYLLQDAAGRRLAGDLPASAARNGSGYVLHYAESASDRSGERMVARRTNLPGGLVLVVATDSFDVQDLRDQLGRFTLISGLAIAALAVLGGFLVGGAFLKRLNGVNLAIERIIAGDRSERLPMIGFGPEFDDLAFNLNRMLDRNAAAMEALRQVSTDIAHDLRTPLTRLHQRLERMLATGGDRVGIEEALTQTDALLTTFQALLRIGTLEGGVGRQRFTTVDLSEVMDRVCQAYVPVVEDAGQTLTAEHLPDVSVLGDAELLAQLVTNLIENAIVHTPPGTRIVSRLRLVDGTPVAEICDDGPGIPAEEREKVFRRFYRRDASRSTDGAGLGLALVSAVSALHQAACSIPDADGGLCVRIEFPPSR